MAELEEANRKVEEARASAFNAPLTSHSTTYDSATLVCSVTGPEIEEDGHDLVDSSSKHADVMDWIGKARESISAFGGYINMGDSSVTLEVLPEVEEEVVHEPDNYFIIADAVDGGDGGGFSDNQGSDYMNYFRLGKYMAYSLSVICLMTGIARPCTGSFDQQ